MNFRIATPDDKQAVSQYDKHVARSKLNSILSLGRLIIAEENNNFIGWLRWNLFWDNTPFMNMLTLS